MQNLREIDENRASIGVFDSGIGGLTVLKALQQHFPHENYVYLGDTARLPYGTKSPETVIKYAESLTRILLERNIKAIVIACNTASTHAQEAVTLMAKEIPVIGMIHPAAKAAIKATKSHHIGVMATFGTIKSNAYTKAIHHLNPDMRVSPVACQMLVALAEEGWADTNIARATLEKYLNPIFKEKNVPDTLILGCTHFPLFAPLIQEIVGTNVKLINSGEAAASTLAGYLTPPDKSHTTSTRFLVTDDISRFADNAQKFFGNKISEEQIELVDV